MATEKESKKWLRQWEWVGLGQELRAKLRAVFNIPKSEQTVVRDDVLMSDGVTQSDLMSLTIEALQESLGGLKGDFDELFEKALELVEGKTLTEWHELRATAGKDAKISLVSKSTAKRVAELKKPIVISPVTAVDDTKVNNVPKGIPHLVSQADLDLNPELVTEGVKVGDEIEVPASGDADADARMNNLNATPEELALPATPEQIKSAQELKAPADIKPAAPATPAKPKKLPAAKKTAKPAAPAK